MIVRVFKTRSEKLKNIDLSDLTNYLELMGKVIDVIKLASL